MAFAGPISNPRAAWPSTLSDRVCSHLLRRAMGSLLASHACPGMTALSFGEGCDSIRTESYVRIPQECLCGRTDVSTLSPCWYLRNGAHRTTHVSTVS